MKGRLFNQETVNRASSIGCRLDPRPQRRMRSAWVPVGVLERVVDLLPSRMGKPGPTCILMTRCGARKFPVMRSVWRDSVAAAPAGTRAVSNLMLLHQELTLRRREPQRYRSLTFRVISRKTEVMTLWTERAWHRRSLPCSLFLSASIL